MIDYFSVEVEKICMEAKMSFDEVESKLSTFIKNIGTEHFAVFVQPDDEDEKILFLGNYPEEWKERYLNSIYHTVDYAHPNGKMDDVNYTIWGNHLLKNMTEEQKNLHRAAMSYGIVCGVTLFFPLENHKVYITTSSRFDCNVLLGPLKDNMKAFIELGKNVSKTIEKSLVH